MSWAKLCGSYAFHRKVLEVGNEGAGAQARMIAYAAENLTGGKISRSAALTIAPQSLIDRLVEVALLERDGDAYIIHDFGDYNPSGPELEARISELKAKRAEAGRRGAAARWGHGSNGKADGNLPSSLPSKPHGNGDGKNMPTSPSPSPYPVTVGELAPTEPPDPGATGSTPKAKKEPKHTPEQISAKALVLEHFVRRFEEVKGCKPKAIDAADNAAAFRLAGTYGPDEAKAIIDRAFKDPFVVDKNATLKFIASKADTFRGKALSAEPRVARINNPVQKVPDGGSRWISAVGKGVP